MKNKRDKLQEKLLKAYGPEKVLNGITVKKGLPISALITLTIAIAIIVAGGAVMVKQRHDLVVASRDK